MQIIDVYLHLVWEYTAIVIVLRSISGPGSINLVPVDMSHAITG